MTQLETLQRTGLRRVGTPEAGYWFVDAEGRAVWDGELARIRELIARAPAVKATAARLGNTPAVCHSAYIFPAVLQGFARGDSLSSYLESVDVLARQKGLHRCERDLLALLAQG